MCGIGGIVFSSLSKAELESKVAPFNEIQRHRGPDAQEHYISWPCLLMHQRLILLDAEGGCQPFHDEANRYALSWNGEIYNHEALREKLKSEFEVTFITRSDTEVLLYLLIHYGLEGLNQIEGMFAGAFWDVQEEHLILFRDAIGIKPLVYAYHDEAIYFASEVKGLLTLLPFKAKLHEDAIVRHWIMPSLSMTHELPFQGMYALQEGNALKVNRHAMQTIEWNKPAVFERPSTPADLLKALSASVDLTAKADVKVGIFLSGGLDSSLLYVLAKSKRIEMQSLSLDFDDLAASAFDNEMVVNSDDRPFIKGLVSRFDGKHQWVRASFKDYLELVKSISIANDRIPSWEQEMSQHLLAKQAAQTLRAVLVGDAADELFYGYHFCLDSEANGSIVDFFNKMGAALRLGLLKKSDATQNALDALLQSFQEKLNAHQHTFEHENARIDAITFLIQKYWLQRLMHHGDIHLMHYGLEGRLPFANRMVKAIANGLSAHDGFKNGIEKAFLREAAKGWLPDQWRLRKKSALPRDPRQRQLYADLLKEVLGNPHPFILRNFDTSRLDALLQKSTWNEWEGQSVFLLLTLHFWLAHYASE